MLAVSPSPSGFPTVEVIMGRSPVRVIGPFVRPDGCGGHMRSSTGTSSSVQINHAFESTRTFIIDKIRRTMTELLKRPTFKAIKATFLLDTDPTPTHPLHDVNAGHFNLLTYTAGA